MRCSNRFDDVVSPFMAVYDIECSTIYEVLPTLEVAVSNGYKVILFVLNCDDELIKTLHMNCLR